MNILVTGAGQGMGRLLALHLAKNQPEKRLLFTHLINANQAQK